MPAILFAQESAESRSLPLSAQRLVNLFVESQPQGAKSQTPLFGVPGMSAFAAAGNGPIRGGWVMGGTAYVVSNTQLYSLATDGTATLLGDGIGGTNNVSMSDNGTQLCIVNGANGWIYSVATGLIQIASDAFYPANTVTFYDGYFVFDRIGTNEFFLSALYDGTSYNGLDFASAESQPDFVTATMQNLELLFIFCQAHIEIWYDAGSADFPFQRYSGGALNYGCVSPLTVVKQDGALFFLGSDKVFYRMQGNTPFRVSNHPMEHIIAQDPNITQAFCFAYTLEGHKFVVLTLPASQRTLVLDISANNRWHERESWDQNNVTLNRWRANCAFVYNENTYFGDAYNGNVNLCDWSVYTELGNTIRGLAYSIAYHQDRKRLFFSRFELDIQNGVGAADAPDPQIALSWSIDGARTWKTLQPWRSMGRVGEYLKRLRWLRMGNGRQWVFCISITDPVPRVIIAAHADWSVGM